ncbi:G2/mitotic-specific cyclin-1 isoform X2 [Capsicum galapagoense]
MAITDENKSTMIKNSNGQVKGKGDMSTRKFGGVERRNNRRVWGMINQNLIGGNGYPCVVNRGLSGANGIAGKNLPVRAHRPIIRGFAAQVANSQQRCSECMGGYPSTDVEENEAAKDQPVPMSLGKTETASDVSFPLSPHTNWLLQKC